MWFDEAKRIGQTGSRYIIAIVFLCVFSFCNFVCIHVCGPGDLARTVQTAGDVL